MTYCLQSRISKGRATMFNRVMTIAGVAFVSMAARASAQWTVENLHPDGAAMSSALSVQGSRQAGYADVGGVRRACAWTGTAASWLTCTLWVL